MHKSVLKMFGVALMAAFSLMALFAVAAQAEDLIDGGKEGFFLVLKEASLVKGAKVTGAQVGAGKLLIPSKNAYVECATGKILSGEGLNEKEILAVVRFEKCFARDLKTNALLTFCPIEGEPSKETIDATGIALARLHGGELFLLFHPHVGKNLAEIKFGPECGIGVKVKIAGLLGALVHEGNVDLTSHLLLFSEAIQKLLGGKLLYGAAESYVDGHATASLTGIHTGCTWALH